MDVFATDAVETGERVITISDSAAKRLTEIFEAEDKSDLMLRITVSGGGCSGFQYGFDFEQSSHDDDAIFEHAGAKVVVDDTSLGLIAGSELDFVVELVGASFQVKNPQATSSCGCGAPFSM